MRFQEDIRNFVTRRPWTFAIITGIGASILFSLILEPITKAAREAIFASAKGSLNAFADQIVERAAADPQANFMIASLAVLFGFILMGGIALQIYTSSLDDRSLEIISEIDKHINGSAIQESESSDWDDLLRRAKVNRSRARSLKWNAIVALAFIFFGTSREIILLILSLSYLNGFSERMEIVSPILNPKEISQYYLRWNKIDKLAEYKALMKDIEVTAKAHGIELKADEIGPSLEN